MQMMIHKKNIFGKIDTALSALRRGSFVMIRDQNQRAGFVRAAEFADYQIPEIFQLKQTMPTLCFTNQQVKFLRPSMTSKKPAFSLPTRDLKALEIIGLSTGA